MMQATADGAGSKRDMRSRRSDRLGIYLVKKGFNYFWEIIDVMSVKSERIAAMYEKSIGEQYRNEFQKSGLSETGKILHIGCGAYPLSELSIARFSKGDIVGIDKNPKAVRLANRVIKKKDLAGRISIVHGNGVNFEVDGFDAIIISSCSLPKGRILDNVFRLAKKKSMIIVRETSIATSDVFASINDRNDITLVKRLHNTPGPPFSRLSWNTFFLTKQ
jgi:precorrin-6B methylase 2